MFCSRSAGFLPAFKFMRRIMSSGEESEDFDPSPVRTKRRKLKHNVLDDIESDSENFIQHGTNLRQGPRTKRKVATPLAQSPSRKQQKSKHLIHIHQAPAELKERFMTQIPDITSSPSQIRGPIWKKPQRKEAEVDVEEEIEGNASEQQPKLTQHNGDVVTKIHSEAITVWEDKHSPHSMRNDVSNLRQKVEYIDKITNVSVANNTPRNTTFEVHSIDEDAFDETLAFSPVHEAMPAPAVPKVKSTSLQMSISHDPSYKKVESHNLIAPSQANYDIAQELEDLPSDAFASSSSSSPQKSPVRLGSDVIMISSGNADPAECNLIGPQKNLRQMTLFGGAAQSISEASQLIKKHNYPLMNKNEKPTHHNLNHDSLQTWVYPTNLGTIRDYQFNIVARGLFHNLLVALPTGLGKTFIAATIMLNWFRWTKDAKIVFVAPTRPLVSQQVEACFGIAGIPRSQTSMLTGGISPGLRAEEYARKRVFFMTPQTIINDLKTGICDPKQIVLLVVDEAHRATGAYAYVEVVKFLRRFNESFRVLALTATPGGSVEAVQEVIDGLNISRVEIRTELSLDIRHYVHTRKTESITFENSEEMELIMDLFAKALQPVLNRLTQFNAYWSRDPMQLTAYGLTQARQRWMGTPAAKNANFAVKGMVNRLFTVLASLAHSIELLKFHGIGPFFHGMVSFRNAQEGSKGGKYEKEILESEHFNKMMTRLQFWINNPTFIGHPKLDYLQGIVLDHFVAAAEGRGDIDGVSPAATRIMIFAHYRDSAEEIVRVLKRNDPIVRAHVFVGQAASKGSEGMDQKKQLEIIQDFKTGRYNTLVATSIGEEGLDIGEVDMIICYDSSASPIRMLQRMGRTGRKRAGKIVLLLMKGKEEKSFVAAKDNYEKMQQMIAAGTRFTFHEDLSPRIVPKDVQPIVDKRVVEIPTENTQRDLPEPKKRAGRAPKRPPKKFHMPDGVRTGFVRASRVDNDEDDEECEQRTVVRASRKDKNALDDLEAIPSLSEVLLNKEQRNELLIKYRNFRTTLGDETVPQLRFSAHTQRQRSLRPTTLVRHGEATKNGVKMLQDMHTMNAAKLERFRRHSKPMQVKRICGEDIRIVSDDFEAIECDLPQVPQARARKIVAARLRNRTKKTKTMPVETTHHAATEALSSSPPATSPRMQMQSQGISLGSDTSREDEVEEPDSELRDFIVDDAEEDEDDRSATTSSLSLIEHASAAPFYVSQKDIGSSSGDELQDLHEVLKSRSTIPVKSKPRVLPATKRKRNVIDDSSD